MTERTEDQLISVGDAVPLLGRCRQTCWEVFSSEIPEARQVGGRWLAPRSAVLAYKQRRDEVPST